jgi:hypothetical protein
MRHAAELDRDLRRFHRQPLAGAQKKRHAVPPPVVHKQFHRRESLRIRIMCHARFIAICADLLAVHFSRAILAAHGTLSDVVGRNRANRVKHIDFFVADLIGTKGYRSFHRDEAEQL